MQKTTNKHVLDTQEQIDNTIQTLNTLGLLRVFKDIVLFEDKEKNIAFLTWDNHVPGRHNAGKAFTTVNQYVSIYETGAYHCILFDGSIIRVSFEFHKNLLVNESLLYWPAPIDIPAEDIEELGIREAMNQHLALVNSNSAKLKMRTPLRLDFDPSNARKSHPETHIHMQHEACRISVKKPVCFNTFIRFVFLNFYPDCRPEIFDKLQPLHYSGYSRFEQAIISL